MTISTLSMMTVSILMLDKKKKFFTEKFLDKFLTNQQMACGTVLGITLMKQLNVRRCKRLRVAKGPVIHIL